MSASNASSVSSGSREEVGRLLDDSLRRNWVAQLAQERAQKAREHRRTYDDHVEPKPFEKSRWLGLQVRSLLALVAVAEEGSFVGAARRLGYSRSTISHQISQLEAAVGASLLVRGSGSRSILVTPAGRIVVSHGRAVLRLLANAEAQLADASGTERPGPPRSRSGSRRTHRPHRRRHRRGVRFQPDTRASGPDTSGVRLDRGTRP